MAQSTASDTATNHAERLRVHARTMHESAGEFRTATRGAASELSNAAREQLEARPYATLGACVVAGFLLGGGLTPGVLRRMVGIGGRVAVGAALQRVVEPR